jgi:hypothetical protein
MVIGSPRQRKKKAKNPAHEKRKILGSNESAGWIRKCEGFFSTTKDGDPLIERRY